MLNLLKIQLKMSKPIHVWERAKSVLEKWSKDIKDNEIRFLTVKDEDYRRRKRPKLVGTLDIRLELENLLLSHGYTKIQKYGCKCVHSLTHTHTHTHPSSVCSKVWQQWHKILSITTTRSWFLSIIFQNLWQTDLKMISNRL